MTGPSGAATPLLAAVVPAGVAVVEAWADDLVADLQPGEADVVQGAVASRVAEFATARRCARDALEILGAPRAPVLTGAHREPLWPAGVVGSITHCDGYRAAAVARGGATVASLGIDAEPDLPLPDGVLELVSDPRERLALGSLSARAPHVAWDRLLFCAKEAVYKAWFPVAGRWLGFEDAHVRLADGGFTVSIGPGAVIAQGCWARGGGRLVASLVLDAATARRLAG